MISIGVDVAKGKSTICAIKPYGEIILSPRDYKHSVDDLNMFLEKLSIFKDDVHIETI